MSAYSIAMNDLGLSARDNDSHDRMILYVWLSTLATYDQSPVANYSALIAKFDQQFGRDNAFYTGGRSLLVRIAEQRGYSYSN
jgi:hypothetical protein